MPEEEKTTWQYFELEGSYFRKPARDQAWIEDIWRDEEWEPYEGDPHRPLDWSNPVEAEDLPPGAADDDAG
jgi:hypothetical protein